MKKPSWRRLHYWFGQTVVLALFPVLLAMLLELLINQSIDLQKTIGSGDIILAAFTISATTVLMAGKEGRMTERLHKPFLILYMSSLFQIAVYVALKLRADYSPLVSCILSTLSLVVTVINAATIENELGKEEAGK